MADSNQPTHQSQSATAQSTDAEYRGTIRQLILAPLAGVVVGIGFYLFVAIQQGVWQVAMGAVGLAIAAVLALLAYRSASRKNETWAVWLLLSGVAVAYGLPELFWSGVTAYLAVGGSLLMLLIMIVAAHRSRFGQGIGAVVVFAISIGLINVWQPFQRYDIQQVSIVFVFVGAVTVMLTLAIMFQLLRAFRIGTIRTRLLMAFIGLVLLPVAATGGLSSTIGAASTRTRVGEALSAIGSLKVAEIKGWLDSLQLDLQVELARDRELQRLITLLTSAADSADFQAAYEAQRVRFQDTLSLRQNFEELMLLDANGRIILSTDAAQEGKNRATENFFRAALAGPHLNPPTYAQSLDRFVIYAGVPVLNEFGVSIGVVVGRASLARLNAIVGERAGLGQTGETYIVSANFAILTALRYSYDSRYMRTDGPANAIATEGTGVLLYDDYRGVPVVGAYQWLPELRVALITEQDTAEAFQTSTATLTATGAATVLILVLAIAAALFLTRSIANPIARLASTAEQIAAGDLAVVAKVDRDDELGALAQSFNSMTEQLRSLIGSLEDRVAARTEELRASADVGRAAASNLEADELLRQIVNLIVDRFSLYYAAVFTLDETGQQAVLREATGEAGRVLKQRQHRLDVGGQSMVGQAIARRKANIALDVGQAAVRFANPLLPDTRSEIALPLMVGDHVLGALDVQSTRSAAFDEASAAVLQSMADQIAVALSNAQQFEQTRLALQRAEVLSQSIVALVATANIQEIVQRLAGFANRLVAAHRTAVYLVDHELRQVTVRAGAGDLAEDSDVTYDMLLAGISGLVFQNGAPVLSLSADDGIEPAETRERRVRNNTGALIVVPLTVQGRVIGTITVSNLYTQRLFTSGDVDLLMTLAAQSINAIEKQRLFEQAQQALADLDKANRRLTGEAWSDFTRRTPAQNIRWTSTTQQMQPTDLPEVAAALNDGSIATRPLDGRGQLGVAVPIKLRDVPIGAVHLIVPQQAWTDDLQSALQSIASHVAQAAENARLLEQTEQTAQREKAISGAADKIHRASSLDKVLQTAIAEINRMTGLAGVSVQLGFGQTEAPEGNGHGTTR